jgi:hypothetical protein
MVSGHILVFPAAFATRVIFSAPFASSSDVKAFARRGMRPSTAHLLRTDAESRSLDELITSNVTSLEPKFHQKYGSRRDKLSYGPFNVPTYNGDNDWTVDNLTLPCYNCIIYSMQAGLEYLDGSQANTDNGLEMHHVVLYNTAVMGQPCDDAYDRFFATGNERGAVDLSANG